MAHGSTSLTRSENQRGDDGTGATVQVQATDPATGGLTLVTADVVSTMEAGQVHSLALTPYDDQANRQHYTLGGVEEVFTVALAGPAPSAAPAVIHESTALTFRYLRNLTVAGAYNVTVVLTPPPPAAAVSRALHQVRVRSRFFQRESSGEREGEERCCQFAVWKRWKEFMSPVATPRGELEACTPTRSPNPFLANGCILTTEMGFGSWWCRPGRWWWGTRR